VVSHPGSKLKYLNPRNPIPDPKFKVPNPNQCKIPDKCKCPNPLPVFNVFRSEYPEHYELVKTATSKILTRADDMAVKFNRRYGNIHFNSKYGPATPYGINPKVESQWDEYPYASTAEASFGSVFAAVNKKHNRDSGLAIKRFYRQNTILPRCKFIVNLVP
jgi:hypothetical protein